jgi:hypothetical protein
MEVSIASMWAGEFLPIKSKYTEKVEAFLAASLLE